MEKHTRRESLDIGHQDIPDIQIVADGQMKGHQNIQMNGGCNQLDIYQKPPLKFCKFMANRPKTTLALFLTFHLILVITTGSLIASGYDLFPISFSDVPLNLAHDDTFLRIIAWDQRDSDDSIIPKATTIGERTQRSDALEIIFEAENVFTAENLRSIQTFENELLQVPGYEQYCQLQDGTTLCQKPWSILRLFDGTFGPHFNDPTFSRIPLTLTTLMAMPNIAVELQYFLGKDSIINSTFASSSITRGILRFGTPLSGYTDENDRKEEQEKKLETFITNNYRERLYNAHQNGVAGMHFLFLSRSLIVYDISNHVKLDILLAVGSFAFIFLFMLFQTRSVFVSVLGIFGMLTSFAASNLIYRIVFDYKYFGVFHVLSIFIILGIGADDTFVYFDHWRATSFEKFESLEQRISACYRRASGAIAATSLTTFVAFITNAFSPFLAISAFGIFSAILVLVNFLTSITLFPSVVLNYHLYWENWVWPCCRCFRKSNISPSNRQDIDRESKRKKNLVVRFFCGPYFRFVTHKFARWIIILASLALLIVFTYFASQLKPNKESVELFKPDHNYAKVSSKRMYAFKPSEGDRVVKVYVVWGLQNQDRSSCHKSDYNCPGRTVWDNGFDLNPKPAQIYLKEFCNNVLNMNETQRSRLRAKKNDLTSKTDMKCFLVTMETFLENEESNVLYNGTADFGLPLTENKVTGLMEAYPEYYNISAITNSHYRYLETGLSFWLFDKYSGTITDDYEDYADLVGFSRDNYDTHPINNVTGQYYGTRLKYAAVVINTDLLIGNVGYEEGLPIMEAWEEFVNTEMTKLPPSVSGGFQCTPESGRPWHWLKVQKTLVNSATQGIAVAICLSFLIITLVTQNLVLGFLCTLMIGCVTVTIIGFLPMVGWSLGVLESLNLSFVVGLAVDYIVHLAVGYHSSNRSDRTGRVQDMLEGVGVSIVSGATSTLGASLFLCIAVIVFFMQFGIIMFCTIGFSLIYSLGLFTVLLGLIGPQNNFGSIIHMCRCFTNYFKGKKP